MLVAAMLGVPALQATASAAPPSNRPASPVEVRSGTQTLIQIDSPKAPRSYAFRLQLPPHARAVLRHGSVWIVRSDRVVGFIEAPWASDARGSAVPTYFTLHGSRLVQHIEFPRSTAFPVIADPCWNPVSWNWRGCARGAGAAVLGAGLGTVATNVARRLSAQRLVMMTGGWQGYFGFAVAGCATGMWFG